MDPDRGKSRRPCRCAGTRPVHRAMPVAFALVAAVAWALFVGEARADDPKPVDALVYIEAWLPEQRISIGTGFFIDERHVVTCYHVVEGAQRIIAYDNHPSGHRQMNSEDG